jgi:PAS domain S-box-containing protein
LKDRYGNLIGFIGISVDITERKLAEKALENSERNLRLVLENTYDGINMLDLDTNRYIFLSPSQIKMTGFSAEELEQMTDDEVLEHVHPEDRQISANQKRMIATGEEGPASTEYRWEIKSGEYRWFSDTRTLIRNDQGKPIALVGVSRDITERKQTEAILRQTLLEKSLLVQELQHRVKNSLVIAASLLALEEGNLPDDRTRAIFANTRARFQSMAAVYEQLYQEGGVDQIELHHYIERLVEALSKSYLQPGQMKIVTQLAEVQLDLKRTLTVGLILNELIINAVHYAFPEGRISPGGSGIIRVEMAQTAGQVILCVADNGIGMTDETSRPGGMGLILVKMLTRQMDGTFTREDGNGCTFRVKFNLD